MKDHITINVGDIIRVSNGYYLGIVTSVSRSKKTMYMGTMLQYGWGRTNSVWNMFNNVKSVESYGGLYIKRCGLTRWLAGS